MGVAPEPVPDATHLVKRPSEVDAFALRETLRVWGLGFGVEG